jgi:hypothetical protein
MRAIPRLVVLALAALPAGCATGQAKLQVFGRPVTVVISAPEKEKVQGELLAVADGRLWLRTDSGVREIPLAAVREVRVKRHGFGARQALTWAGVGGLVTGGALAAACATVEDSSNCAVVGLVVAGTWMAVGALSARSVESSSLIRLPAPAAADLRPLARFPQGPPDGLDLRSLAAPAPRRE